jgi:hypothetical protein
LSSPILLTFSYVLVPQKKEMVAKRDLGLFAWLYGAPLDCKTVPPQLRARGLGQPRISKKKCYFRSLDHRFRPTVISPYPFMDASASLRVLHQMAAAICAIPLALGSTTRKTVVNLRFSEQFITCHCSFRYMHMWRTTASGAY